MVTINLFASFITMYQKYVYKAEEWMTEFIQITFKMGSLRTVRSSVKEKIIYALMKSFDFLPFIL